jgi:hypothetical protein
MRSGFFPRVDFTGRVARIVAGRMRAVRLVDLAGAMLAIEIMPFTGNGKNTGGHEQHREKFHRSA